MNRTFITIRALFALFCIFSLITYACFIFEGGVNFTNIVLGTFSGLVMTGVLIGIEVIANRCPLKTFNTALIGLFFGYLFGQAFLMVIEPLLKFSNLSYTAASLVNFITNLSFAYLGTIFALKNKDEWQFTIPYFNFKKAPPKKKDLLIDWTILLEPRILDLASSGLLDESLIIPRFILKELYHMLDSSDEIICNRGRRALDIFKKLELMPTLELRYDETDPIDFQDSSLKLLHLARIANANILTGDINRFQLGTNEGVRIINLQILSNTLKPITGEQLSIKVQRYGKEPRQGVGYLEDGTMVVVNGGAEYIGDTVKAHVLSVKHTTSGRMIFCNVSEAGIPFEENISHASPTDLETSQRHYL